MKIKTIIVYIGYGAVFLISLYLFVILSMPDEQIATYINERLIKQNGINLSYKSAHVSYKMSLVFSEVEIEIPEVNQKLSFERVEGGISLVGYLFGKRPFIIGADGFGGSILVEVGSKKDMIFLSLEVEQIEMLKLDILREKTGLNIKGIMNLTAEIVYDGKESKNNNGRVSLEFKDSEIKSGKVMGFEIPQINTGDIRGEIEIKEGKFKVTNLKSKGKDIELRLSGDGSFQSPPTRSSLNLSLKIKPAQAFIDREEKLKTILFGIGSSLDKEGFYNFSIKGTLSNPSFGIEKK
ncbi:MAG: type II secretion system protein GspN [Deltaproteobacteria bacterium]|nr:type II secretion system protein GspN [Deltaproteobacteria bacterium]